MSMAISRMGGFTAPILSENKGLETLYTSVPETEEEVLCASSFAEALRQEAGKGGSCQVRHRCTAAFFHSSAHSGFGSSVD